MKYFLLKTDVFPEEFADGEKVILIQDEDGSEEIEACALEFVTTLVVNSIDETKSLIEFSNWWKVNAPSKYEIELISDEIQSLNSERREFVLGLSEGEWSLKDAFIAYRKGDEESEQYAREIIYESEFEVQ